MSREVRVRTTLPLRNATLADPALPLSPRQAPTEHPPTPVLTPPAPPSAPAPSQPPPPEVDETIQRLAADRELIEKTLAGLTGRIGEFLERRDREQAEWRWAAVELGVTLAARLLHDRIVAGDFPVEALVREMIGHVGQGPITVSLHPNDAALLQSRLSGEALVEGDGLRIVHDAGLARGDCRVESREGFVLSQLAAQLTEMRGRLLRSLGDVNV